MASAAPRPTEPTQVRPSFAKVAATTYKPQASREGASSVKSPVAIPQTMMQCNTQKRSVPTNGATPVVHIETNGPDNEAKEKAGNTATRTGQWAANATREQAALQSESKRDEAEKPRPSIALVKFSATEDSTTQLSSSDGSAKPPSIDGKSVASGTTFALDEKESIRPDDSASLRAVEEEDVTSTPESNPAGSRAGSDSEARAFRAQLHEIAVMGPQPQRGIVPVRFPNPNTNGPPALYDPSQPSNGLGRPMSQPLVNGMPTGAVPQNMPTHPDEKLIEALQSPRDRLFVVKIEQDFIDFIKDSSENEYCLPNCNTFYRMLAHRLADYYLLGHVVDSTMTGVRITRTPYCRIPPPLSQMIDATKGADTPPVDLPARKIMRRGDEKSGTNTTANSENPSKATSEVGGSDGSNDKEANGKPKDKSMLTREEREARYREARQRIFGSAEAEESEQTDTTSTEDKDASRSSSASGKKKNKKQRNTDDDDGFEARSRFNAYYPGSYAAPGYPGDGTVYYNGFPGAMPNPQYAPMPSNASSPQNYNNGYSNMMPQEIQPQYGWSNQQFSAPNAPMVYPAYGPMQNGYDLSNDFQRGMQSFQSSNLPNQMTPKMTNASMANYQDPYAQSSPSHSVNAGWSQSNQQSGYPMQQGPYPPNGSVNRPIPGPMQQGHMPSAYPYGQFPPPSFNGKNNRHQHPIPGSYQRPQFNPQSQAFVPGGHNMPYQMPPNVGGPAQGLNGYGGFQVPGNPQIPHQMPRPSPPSNSTQAFGSPGHLNNNLTMTPSSLSSSQTASSQNSVPVQSSIAKYGTPSNLPARPPPTQSQAPKFNINGHNVGVPNRVPSNPNLPFASNPTSS
ncbi:hypothetical protein DM02DRAFT_231980 [Periconia macrospinosa]|uniref:SUZ domain-containing protein n=1 Tax=Periconia macrospinosa TaxID=97972 RepID=A0A2V1ECL7_9PLEO|nr:hypothetical protein DM02DRAFT_231980 [Periconia macrospinosa]